MTVPSYTADLTTITAADALGTFVEPGTWTGGGTPAAETDYFLQGTGCVSKPFTTGTPPLLGGAIFDNGSGITVPTDGAVFFWFYYQCPNAIDTETNGGARLLVGSAQGSFYAWKIKGKDTYTYGGWLCLPVNPNTPTTGTEGPTADYTVGTPSSTKQWFGQVCNVLATSKGNALGTDAIRYGRGEMKVEFGALADGFAVFSGIAAYNDGTSNRFGLFQATDSGYLYQGLLLLGSATNAVDFRDSNANILIPHCKKVSPNFNTIEIRNASSRVDWTNVAVSSLSTVSRGRFIVTDNADVNFSLCQFNDMGVFSLLSATDMLNCVWRRCDQITAPGANLSGSEIRLYTGAANTSAVVWNVATDTDGKLDNTVFEKGTNAHHAIELGTTSPLTVTLRGVTFSGFNTANAQNDSVIHVKRTTGTVTINTVNCSGTVSYKTEGAAVSIVVNPVSLAVHVQRASDGTAVVGARVLAKAAAGGPYPYQSSVSITRTGGTATVTHTGHGLSTNDYVVIEGCAQGEYNIVAQITVTDINTYTYAVSGSPATPATGTPKATFAMISGTTNASGDISASKSYASNQSYTGMVRLSTSSPYYKPGPFSGTINASSGASATVQMVLDE